MMPLVTNFENSYGDKDNNNDDSDNHFISIPQMIPLLMMNNDVYNEGR